MPADVKTCVHANMIALSQCLRLYNLENSWPELPVHIWHELKQLHHFIDHQGAMLGVQYGSWPCAPTCIERASNTKSHPECACCV